MLLLSLCCCCCSRLCCCSRPALDLSVGAGRKFLPDRLEVHFRGCSAIDKAGQESGGGSCAASDASGGSGGGGSSSGSSSRKSGKSTGRGGKGGKKVTLPVCYLCGRQFGTSSLAIHIKECQKKYEREHGKPAPPPPEMFGAGGGGGEEERPLKPTAKDWAQYNDAAWASAQAQVSAGLTPAWQASP